MILPILSFKKSRGFTFVEALVVVAIFTGFIVAASGVFISAYRAQVGSYQDELDEQSSMRGAFELEHVFRSSVGYQLIDSDGSTVVYDEADKVKLLAPNPSTGLMEYWEFSFLPDGTDILGRIKGSFVVKAPEVGTNYLFTSNVSLPLGRDHLFVLDDLGRVSYHWMLRGEDADLSWKGNLAIAQ